MDKKNLVQKWNLLVWRLWNTWNKSHSHGDLSASAQRLMWALVLRSQGARFVCSVTAPPSRASESSVPDSSFFHSEQNPCPGRETPPLGPTWHFWINIWSFYQRACSEHILLLSVCHLWLLGTWRVFSISDWILPLGGSCSEYPEQVISVPNTSPLPASHSCSKPCGSSEPFPCPSGCSGVQEQWQEAFGRQGWSHPCPLVQSRLEFCPVISISRFQVPG